MVRSAHEPVDQITGVARSLVGDRGAWRRLLAEHVADDRGHCRGRRFPSRPGPVWPCRLHAIGAEAQRIAATRPAAMPAATEDVVNLTQVRPARSAKRRRMA